MEKEKKVINVLTILFISHKSDVKTFINWILNQCHLYEVPKNRVLGLERSCV